jgi:uncharacterized tellurite resistance protein B-like protein
MEEAQRRRVCQLIAGIVITDDIMEPEEEAFLDRMIARFGLEAEGRDAIFPLVSHEEAAAAAKALPPKVQREAFDLLTEAALADGKVVPEELAYLKVVAEAMGMDDDDIEDRLKPLAQYVAS